MAARIDIVRGNIADQSEESCLQIVFRCLEVSRRSLYAAPSASEQIKLPAGIETGLKLIVRIATNADCIVGRRTALVPCRRPGACYRRKQSGSRLSQRIPRFPYLGLRCCNVEIGGGRFVDEGIKQWIVEAAPPVGEMRRTWRLPCLIAAPTRREIDDWRAVIRANGAPR